MKNKKSLLTGLFLCTFWVLHAQLLIKVTAVPANTPAGADIYVAGSFNNWNPGNPAFKLTPLGGGQYQISINPPVGQYSVGRIWEAAGTAAERRHPMCRYSTTHFLCPS